MTSEPARQGEPPADELRAVAGLIAVLIALGLAGLALSSRLSVYLVSWVVIGLGMGTGCCSITAGTSVHPVRPCPFLAGGRLPERRQGPYQPFGFRALE